MVMRSGQRLGLLAPACGLGKDGGEEGVILLRALVSPAAHSVTTSCVTWKTRGAQKVLLL